jgi:serine/threonine-protein kinase
VGAEHEIVALKLIHGELLGDKQIAGRFRREAKILQRLAGPHLCPLLDVVEDEGLILLALEYVDGPSLERYLAEYSAGDPPAKGALLPMEEIVALMAQICAALQVAHDAGVIHRDLKPSNVLIGGGNRGGVQSFTRDLSARVVDFGLAKILQGDNDQTALTERNMIFGTPEYMAPEQVAGEAVDARADIYAAGVLLYQLLTGRLPFECDGAVATMKAHLGSEVPSPRDVAPSRDIGTAVEQVVLKALAKDAGDRYASAQQLSSALIGAVERRASDSSALVRPSDTHVDVVPTASTTMQSLREEASAKPRGGKVRVVVPDSAGHTTLSTEASQEPANEPKPDRASQRGPSDRPSAKRSSKGGASSKGNSQSRRIGDGEGRLWTIVAVVAAIAAVAGGVWLGLR